MLLDTLQPRTQCHQARTESTDYVLPYTASLTLQDCHYTLLIGFVLQNLPVLLDLSLLEIKVITHKLFS